MRYFIMAKKITRKEVLTSIIAEFKADGVAKMTEDRVEVLEKLLASIEKKSSKVSAKSTENEGIKDLIETSLGVIGEPVTVSVLNKSEGLIDFSNQKLSNLLRQMIEEGRVVKSTKGRQSLFSLADDSEVADED
jgi:hypothetical protein